MRQPNVRYASACRRDHQHSTHSKRAVRKGASGSIRSIHRDDDQRAPQHFYVLCVSPKQPQICTDKRGSETKTVGAFSSFRSASIRAICGPQNSADLFVSASSKQHSTYRHMLNRQSKIDNVLVNANVPRSQLSGWQRCRVNCQTHAIACSRNTKRHT